MVTDTDRAYAAGLIDGEGSISASPSYHCPQNFRVSVEVAMCDCEAIQWLADTFGGKVKIASKPTKSGKPIFWWSLYCKKAAYFLELVLPYLKIKRSRAINAIALAKMMTKRPRKKGDDITVDELSQRRFLANKIRNENIASNGRLVRHASKEGVGA